MKKIKLPKFNDILLNFGIKFEKGKVKFVKPHKIVIIGFIIFIINFFMVNYWFNGTLAKKVPIFYNSLIKVSKVKSFGWLGLIGKKASNGKFLVAVTSLPIIKEALKSSIIKALFLNLGICLLFVLSKGKKKNTSQGTAEWGGLEEVDFKPGNDKFFGSSLISDKGVVLGRMKGVTLRDNNKTHICVVAPTRTGKGVSIIIPTLIDSWSDGVLVLDIKGENYQLTSGARKEKFDNLILRFAPKSENSCKYNALSEVRLMFPEETEDVKVIVNIICGVSDIKGNNKHLNESIDFIFAVIFYVLYRNFLRSPKFICKNGIKKPVSDANINDVRNFIVNLKQKQNMQEELKKMVQNENFIEKYAIDEETKTYVRKKLLELYGDTDKESIENGNHPKFILEFMKSSLLPKETFDEILKKVELFLSYFC